VAIFNAMNNATTTTVEGFGLEQWCFPQAGWGSELSKASKKLQALTG